MTRTLAAVASAALMSLYAPSSFGQTLEPPPPTQPPPPASPQSPGSLPSGPPQESDDESKDSGLGLEWVWLNADVGFAFANMNSFSASQLALTQTSGSGPAFGVGAGVRLLFLTAGLRLRDALISSIGSLWDIDLEAALHMRVWHIDPYLGVRGGYAFVGSLDTGSFQAAAGVSSPNVAVNGFDVGPMLGIDLYLSSLVSIGAEGVIQFLFLQRSKAQAPDLSQLPPAQQMMVEQQIQSNPLYQNSGSSVGIGGGVTAHLGIHF